MGLLSFYQRLSGFMFLHANGEKNGVKYEIRKKKKNEVRK